MDPQSLRPPVCLLSVLLCQLSAWLMPGRLFGWTLILGIAGLPSYSALRDKIKSLSMRSWRLNVACCRFYLLAFCRRWICSAGGEDAPAPSTVNTAVDRSARSVYAFRWDLSLLDFEIKNKSAVFVEWTSNGFRQGVICSYVSYVKE